MGLHSKQTLAAELLADPTNTQTYAQIAKECGVTVLTLRKWRTSNDEFLALLDKRTTDLVRACRREAYRCLMHNVRKNDRASAHTLLQATGDIGSGGTVIHNTMKQTNTPETFEDFVGRITRDRPQVATKE